MKSKLTPNKARFLCELEARNGNYQNALNIVEQQNLSGVTVTRNSLKAYYGLSDKQIDQLHFVEISQPHYKADKGPLRLYLIAEVMAVIDFPYRD